MYIFIITLSALILINLVCLHLVERQNIINDIESKLDYRTQEHPILKLNNTDKIIWTYWNSKDIPTTVKLAIHTWRRWNPDYIICVVNKENLNRYLDPATFPKNFAKKAIQIKADIIRLGLIEKYGGIWLDATIFINKPLSQVWDPKNYDVGGYQADYFTTNQDYPVFENWFISAPKHSELIIEWKKEFYKAVDYSSAGDYIKDLEREVDLQNIKYRNYLMMHCCFLKVINNKKYNIKLFTASDGPFEYLVKHKWSTYYAVNYLLYNKKDKIPDMIKIRSAERLYLDIIFHTYSEHGILHRIIEG